MTDANIHELGEIETTSTVQANEDGEFVPQNMEGRRIIDYSPEQAKAKAKLVAKTRREWAKGNTGDVEVDDRSVVQMLEDRLQEMCDENDWVLEFDQDEREVRIIRESLTFKIYLDTSGSGIEEGVFAHKFRTFDGLANGLENGFDFPSGREDSFTGDGEEQFDRSLDIGLDNDWDVMPDDENPDIVNFFKGPLTILARWTEDDLVGHAYKRISSFNDVYKIIREYGSNGDKNGIHNWT